MTVAHHAALERLVLIDLRLTSRTGLHIGAGKSLDISASDLPVVKDGAGNPLIPGSSLRGILRSGAEAIVQSLNLRDNPTIDETGLQGGFLRRWTKLGLVDRLFGCAARKPGDFSYASRLHVSDGRCERLEFPLELRDGVAITRETRTAARGAKFDLEVVPAGTRFTTRLRFKNPQGFELGLVAQTLWMLNEGMLQLGGGSARGLGWMKVESGPPWDLDTQQILTRQPAPTDIAFGKVEERLSEYLANLERFVAEAGGQMDVEGK